jgi:uncharacterized protein YbcC (UPF0753/DUF2309 family)
LPSQGPITSFVHHNTLHGFEDRPFDQGLAEGSRTYGCEAYLSEDQYRSYLATGRIRLEDLEAALLDDPAADLETLIGLFGTRFHLRLAMLQFPLRSGSEAELRWVIAETDARRRFRSDVSASQREQVIAETLKYILSASHQKEMSAEEKRQWDFIAGLKKEFGHGSPSSWNMQAWEAMTLHFLWQVCLHGVHSTLRRHQRDSVEAKGLHSAELGRGRRHRDVLLAATGEDTDEWVHERLIRFTASFLDQGLASWSLPGRDQGFFRAFLDLHAQPTRVETSRQRALTREARRVAACGQGPLESIAESLAELGIADSELDDFVLQTLLALGGWAGMVWQMETNAEWMPHPAPRGSLIEFLAVRLILERVAIASVASEFLRFTGPLRDVRRVAQSRMVRRSPVDLERRAFTVFQVAQIRGWRPHDLQALSREQWEQLLHEIDAFGEWERRRVFHRAFERRYRQQALDAIVVHSQRVRAVAQEGDAEPPAFQLVTCIDDREESFRRHLEEVDPECETFGVAGFFGVAMYYRGATDAHFAPLCPVVIKPRHFVCEEPAYTFEGSSQLKSEARRRIGQATYRAHVGSRTFLGGLFTGLFGSLAAIPLVARVLFPRTTAQIRRLFGRLVQPPVTQLRLDRVAAEPGPENGHLGYSLTEMAEIVEGTLRAIGLTRRFAKLVLICGHGSSSLNNPHESAYNCGACSGNRGGPNARAFAQMANNERVRQMLRQRGFQIPDETFFVGGYHNTCDDSVVWYDLDRLPAAQRDLFERAAGAIDTARRRNAHERCRRFESADLSLSFDDALRHVETRAEDLSQARPEYNHATNALCLVGQRAWSRGLFLDRRAFLASYDPAQDDAAGSILGRILGAVIPVCAGISLEYYFSTVDPEGFGCGNKLPHNIASLLGVMTGAASDLRPGLSAQMVEIHEPLRILFVIETTADAMLGIIERNATIAQLVRGEWVQLAVFDAATSAVQVFRRGRFEPYSVESSQLPTVSSSLEWYRGQRGHLGFASIVAGSPGARGQAFESAVPPTERSS